MKDKACKSSAWRTGLRGVAGAEEDLSARHQSSDHTSALPARSSQLGHCSRFASQLSHAPGDCFLTANHAHRAPHCGQRIARHMNNSAPSPKTTQPRMTISGPHEKSDDVRRSVMVRPTPPLTNIAANDTQSFQVWPDFATKRSSAASFPRSVISHPLVHILRETFRITK